MRLARIACVTLLLAACGEDEAPLPVPGVEDGGAAEADAAGLPDAGAPSADAGGPDAAALPDAGAPDAAIAGPDAGRPDAAAGPDAGRGPLTGCIEGTFNAYYGNLHSHTAYSDGEMKPSEAFDFARYNSGLDVMIVTDHLEQLYNLVSYFPPTDRYAACREQADAKDAPGEFVAACGFEYATFSQDQYTATGHTNVFFAPSILGFNPAKIDYHDMYAAVVSCPECIAQMNHPNNQGLSQYNYEHFVYDAPADSKIDLMEFNGEGPVWDLFFEALDQGWTLSPAFNEDNHRANFGAGASKTGLWMGGLTRSALIDVMRQRRTFMTKDKTATVKLMALDRCWMGSVLSHAPASMSVKVEVVDSEAADGFATIELFGPGMSVIGTKSCGGASSCVAEFAVPVNGATYAVARANQADGDYLVSAPVWASP